MMLGPIALVGFIALVTGAYWLYDRNRRNRRSRARAKAAETARVRHNDEIDQIIFASIRGDHR